MVCYRDSTNPQHQQLGQSAIPVKDVVRLQQNDPVISAVLPLVRDQTRPTHQQINMKSGEELQLLRQWNKLCLLNEVLYRKRIVDGCTLYQLVLPVSCRKSVLKSLHDDMAH
jgi:hypothetical protein